MGRYPEPAEKPKHPHVLLAELMSRELGTYIGAASLRELISSYWSRIQMLSHAVHDEIEAEKRKPTRTPQQALDAIDACLLSGGDTAEVARIVRSAKPLNQEQTYKGY